MGWVVVGGKFCRVLGLFWCLNASLQVVHLDWWASRRGGVRVFMRHRMQRLERLGKVVGGWSLSGFEVQRE